MEGGPTEARQQRRCRETAGAAGVRADPEVVTGVAEGAREGVVEFPHVVVILVAWAEGLAEGSGHGVGGLRGAPGPAAGGDAVPIGHLVDHCSEEAAMVARVKDHFSEARRRTAWAVVESPEERYRRAPSPEVLCTSLSVPA